MLNQLVRFGPVLTLLDELGGGELLEVGSGSRGLTPWLDERWQVTSVDKAFDDYGTSGEHAHTTAVEADARALPFADRRFDAVVCLDMLEHVPQPDRATVLGELARTGRRRVIVGCPAGERALAADRRLARFYEGSGEPLPPWLDEHLQNGFPEPGELLSGLSGSGAVRLIANESAAAHFRLMRVEANRWGLYTTFAIEALLAPGLRRPPRRWSERALRVVRGFDRAPSYRTLAVLDIHAAER